MHCITNKSNAKTSLETQNNNFNTTVTMQKSKYIEINFYLRAPTCFLRPKFLIMMAFNLCACPYFFSTTRMCVCFFLLFCVFRFLLTELMAYDVDEVSGVR